MAKSNDIFIDIVRRMEWLDVDVKAHVLKLFTQKILGAQVGKNQ